MCILLTRWSHRKFYAIYQAYVAVSVWQELRLLCCLCGGWMSLQPTHRSLVSYCTWPESFLWATYVPAFCVWLICWHMPGTVFLFIHDNTLLCIRNIPGNAGIYVSLYSTLRMEEHMKHKYLILAVYTMPYRLPNPSNTITQQWLPKLFLVCRTKYPADIQCSAGHFVPCRTFCYLMSSK